ncbi:MAG: IS1634 family transposase [Deltaproteobacteria bacterium]|nr:MAG: IS1634 family transposase [Deltaproteobacteria bacterium]
MYIERVPNRNSPPAVLLREAWREGKRIRKRTIANLTQWPSEKVEALGRLLRNERLVSAREAFVIERTIPHGHVEAILGTIKKLGVHELITATGSRERDLVVAMIAERLIHPCSKLATTRLWHMTTLAEELGVAEADEDDLYEAMDWLLARQDRIEKRLAARHLSEGSLVLYDVTSSYYEGHSCPLARYGHDRDGKSGRPIIVYGLMTDGEGRPVAVEAYPGDTGDPSTVVDQAEKLRKRFGVNRLVLVGDRGMLTQTQINKLRVYPGLGWISALRADGIRKLVKGGFLQMSLFDRKDLAEIRCPDYPMERLVACFNPILAEERRRKRQELLEATEKELKRIAREVARRTQTPLKKEEIGKKVGKVINRYKVGKHFRMTIGEGTFSYERNEDKVRQEAALDGIYMIRTSEPTERLSPEDTVRSYKNLTQVERAFRSLKGIDLLVHPIWHHTEDHVRAHLFLCMLAYYVEWHMRKVLAPLLFDDEELDENRERRDPVKPAKPSVSAQKKKAQRLTAEGLVIQSFDTLLEELGTRSRNRCRIKSDPGGSSFYQMTEMSPLQERAFQLLGLLPCNQKPISAETPYASIS